VPTSRALLLIADIGGYTEYMQFHRSILGHAEAATARLLDRVVRAAPGFKLVEIEGDAAFLSRDLSRDSGSLDGAAAYATVADVVVAMHRAFHAERHFIELNMCPCGSCKRTNALKLKFVAHVGEVATQTIRRRDKLVGVDVIYVHRMLKNPVELAEYVLVSDDLLDGGGSPGLVAEALTMDLEGIGPVQAHVVDVQDLAPPGRLPEPSWPQRIGGTFAMIGRGIPHIVRRRQQSLGAAG
jgi:hypothetical protein